LDETLQTRDFVFVLATAAADSQHLLNAGKLDLLGNRGMQTRLPHGRLHSPLFAEHEAKHWRLTGNADHCARDVRCMKSRGTDLHTEWKRHAAMLRVTYASTAARMSVLGSRSHCSPMPSRTAVTSRTSVSISDIPIARIWPSAAAC